MIRFRLCCEKGHEFDSWFASSGTFDRLLSDGAVACTLCGSTKVAKALMTPAVASGQEAPLDAPRSAIEAALAALRREVEERSDYVGLSFAAEARAMHEGERPHRAIWGEARPDDARALIEDGIPVLPLPFVPRLKTN
jgi:hypothetical protein